MQGRGRDVPIINMPAYVAWSEGKLADGVSVALIAHLDATDIFLPPEEIHEIDDATFEELLSELGADFERQG